MVSAVYTALPGRAVALVGYCFRMTDNKNYAYTHEPPAPHPAPSKLPIGSFLATDEVVQTNFRSKNTSSLP